MDKQRYDAMIAGLQDIFGSWHQQRNALASIIYKAFCLRDSGD
jgi:hypothetical protein